MSSGQADVHSIEALREFRAALALFAEETLAALGAVHMEGRRTVQWVQHDRRAYWQDQIKRRRELVSSARAEVARRRLAKTADHTPAFSEQKEILRKAEAGLREAEMRLEMVKKWEPALQQAVLEYHASTRRISDLASGDIPRAMNLLERLVDALEAYLREAPPTTAGRGSASLIESIANAYLDDASTAAPEAGQPPVEGTGPADGAALDNHEPP